MTHKLPTARGAGVLVEDLVKRFRTGSTTVTALAGVSLAIKPSALVAVTGPSGSGKSTLLQLIGAMERPDGGRITVGSQEVTALADAALPAYRRTIGFVFQRFHLLPMLSALDNVVAPLLPYRTEFDKHARAVELLALVGLDGRERSVPAELSGGEQQRVAIARALVNEPQLLLADEPTGNVDSETSSRLMTLLAGLREKHGMTVVIATHDPLIASRCERVVRLLDGVVRDEVTVSPSLERDALLERITRYDA